MSETRDHDSQNAPKPNNGQFIADMVIEDMAKRADFGLRKYGTKLQAHNGRDALQDAYEEALDLCVYLKQRLVEDDFQEGDVKAIRKKYQYRCKCGKGPMKGGVRLSPGTDKQFSQFFDMLDLTWAESHNQPGCGLKDKTVTTI